MSSTRRIKYSKWRCDAVQLMQFVWNFLMQHSLEWSRPRLCHNHNFVLHNIPSRACLQVWAKLYQQEHCGYHTFAPCWFTKLWCLDLVACLQRQAICYNPCDIKPTLLVCIYSLPSWHPVKLMTLWHDEMAISTHSKNANWNLPNFVMLGTELTITFEVVRNGFML